MPSAQGGLGRERSRGQERRPPECAPRQSVVIPLGDSPRDAGGGALYGNQQILGSYPVGHDGCPRTDQRHAGELGGRDQADDENGVRDR